MKVVVRVGEASVPLLERSEWRPSRKARQLALGCWIERQIEAGRVASYAEMARILGVSRARVTQLVGLGLAPVEVREAILQEPQTTLGLPAGGDHSSSPRWAVASASTQSSSSQDIPCRPGTLRVGPAE